MESQAIDIAPWEGSIYSDGWRAADDSVAVLDKATDATLCQIGVANALDVTRASRIAANAQPDWAALPAQERATILREAARLLQEETPLIREWVARETGGISGKADFEVRGSSCELHEAAALCTQPTGYILPTDRPGKQSYARRIPIGVVGTITPWNFPLLLAMRSVAPALALGNAVLLKPDIQTPVVGGMIIAQVLERAGVPKGVFHVLPGGAETGEALVADPGVGMITFTGSTAVGRRVGEVAGRMLKRVVLELGGNSPYVVLDDADVDAAAAAGAWGSFLHQGQICMASSRHLVQRGIAEAYVERLARKAEALPIGDPFREQVAIGPMINRRQVDRADAIVRASIDAGARLVVGGTHDGRYFRPTVLDGVTQSMSAFSQELFGPIAPVTVFDTDEEAAALANASEYGLAAAVQSGSPARALALGEKLRSGMVHINDQTMNNDAHAPFGGVGASGNGGRFGSLTNREEFTTLQWITIAETSAVYPF